MSRRLSLTSRSQSRKEKAGLLLCLLSHSTLTINVHPSLATTINIMTTSNSTMAANHKEATSITTTPSVTTTVVRTKLTWPRQEVSSLLWVQQEQVLHALQATRS
jgi:hypothetical protein